MDTMTTKDGHTPERPAWTCGACGKDWPCDPAREALAVEYEDRIGLAVYMADQLGQAGGDLFRLPSDELYQRFIAWTRPIPLDRPR